MAVRWYSLSEEFYGEKNKTFQLILPEIISGGKLFGLI